MDSYWVIKNFSVGGAKVASLNMVDAYGQIAYGVNEPRWRFYCVICSINGISSVRFSSNPIAIRLYSNRIYYKW